MFAEDEGTDLFFCDCGFGGGAFDFLTGCAAFEHE